MGKQGKRPAVAVSYSRTGGAQQLIVVVDRCVGIEVEPALAPSCGGAVIPGDAQSLITAAGNGDQMPLQRVQAEGLGDIIIVQWPVTSIGVHEGIAVASEKRRGHTPLSKVAGSKSPRTVVLWLVA
jgi:hypothetical protein